MTDEAIRSLAERVPPDGIADRDEALEVFLDWVSERGIELYPAQEEAILELFSGNHVMLKTPTGSGKSMVATALHFLGLATGKRSYYTSPIKALVSEKFFDLMSDFDALNAGMMTGDSSVNRDAPLVCCTAEIVSNMALRQGPKSDIRQVVMDEFHYYSDRDRGMAWQLPLLVLERAQFLLMSATLGDTRTIEESIEERTGRPVSVVESHERPVPLDFSYAETSLHETIEDLISRDLAPIYLVHFTQRDATEQAQNLMSTNFSTKGDKAAISDEIGSFRFDTPFGKVMKRHLMHGIGLHHAGLLPKYRLLTERLAKKGMLKVISGTDTLGVGVNVPIRTVLFTKLCKYDGEKVGILTVRDFKQVAGRAGRRGYDDKGWVVCQAPEHVIENKKLAAKAASGKKKKVVKKKAPTHNFVNWTESTFRELIEKPPEPLQSRFNIDHGSVIQALQREDTGRHGGGYRALIDVIGWSHERDFNKSRLRRKAKQIFKSLLNAGIVELHQRDAARGREVAVSADLQDDFSLNHTLSLFLVESLEMLNPEEPEYPYQVVSMVEAILENPRPVVIAQERKAKDVLIQRLKSEGVEYDKRMEELEKVTYPKPLEEIIYPAFEVFQQSHPWVEATSIHPKSVVRDMAEQYISFNDYVRHLGIQKAEGVLLRYLSMAYRTIVQNVPESKQTDELLDIIGYIRTTLERVDSSLVSEWERMLAVESGIEAAEKEDAPPPPPDISRNKRAFAARIRAELHALVKALSKRDYEEAMGLLAPDREREWTPDDLESAMADYFGDYEELISDHRSRYPQFTTIDQTGHHQWTVRQTFVDPEGDHLYAVFGRVDLREDAAPEGPLLRLDRIGD